MYSFVRNLILSTRCEFYYVTSLITRKQSLPAGTSAKAKLFARWRHRLCFASGSLMPSLTQWSQKFQSDPESRIPSGSPPKLNHW